MTKSILRKPTKRERDFCCTYGGDSDVIMFATVLPKTCGAHPVVLVDRRKKGVGRCAKHAFELGEPRR